MQESRGAQKREKLLVVGMICFAQVSSLFLMKPLKTVIHQFVLSIFYFPLICSLLLWPILIIVCLVLFFRSILLRQLNGNHILGMILAILSVIEVYILFFTQTGSNIFPVRM